MIDKKEFAKLMLRWGAIKEEMVDIEAAITAEVMELGETVNVGYTSAVYSAGRATYAWEQVARDNNASDELIGYYSMVKTTVKWKDVCRDMRIVLAPVLKAGTPSVTLKLVK